MDVSSIFAFSLIGGLVGYILGDFQREVRYRREARANLALAVYGPAGPLPVSDSVQHIGAVTSSDGDRDADSSSARSLGSIRDGQARRRAVSRPNYGAGVDPALPGGRGRRSTPQAVGAGYDCG